MDGSFDAGLKAGTEVEITASCGGLGTDGFQYTFCPEAAVDLTNSDRTCAWFLVQGNKTVSHHGPVCRPWRMGIAKPICPSRHFRSESIGFSTKSKKPICEIYGISASGTCGSR
jgi:hypothetical protein